MTLEMIRDFSFLPRVVLQPDEYDGLDTAAARLIKIMIF